MNTRALTSTALISGLGIAILSAIPGVNLLNCLFCGWAWLGGIFAVWYYRRLTHHPLTSSEAAGVGAASGLAAAVLLVIFGAIGGGFSILGTLLTQSQNVRNAFGGALGGTLGVASSAIIGLLFNLIFFPAFAALGGLLGAAGISGARAH